MESQQLIAKLGKMYPHPYMDMIMERGTNETMSGKGRCRSRSISKALEQSM